MTTAWGLAAVAVAGCMAGEVEVRFRAEPGATYTYRYEIEATVRRSLDGAPPEVRRTSSVLAVSKRVLDVAPDGTVRAQVAISRDGGPIQRAEVRLDRAGALAGVDLADGLVAGDLGPLGLDGLALTAPGAPPPTLGPGDTWRVDEARQGRGDGRLRATVTGSGRVDRLERRGPYEVLVATTDLTVRLRSTARAGRVPHPRAEAAVRAEQRTVGTSGYDLSDGAVRFAEVHTAGTATVEVPPPPGVDAEPALAKITYEVAVRTRRR